MATTNTPGSAPQRPRQAALASPRPRQAPRRMMRPQRSQWAPFLRIFPMIILLIGLLLPVEVRFNLAGQTFYAYRIAWVLVSFWSIKQILGGQLQPRFVDMLVILASMWMALSLTVVYGFSRGLPSGVALALDVLMPYLATRLAIRTPNDLRHFLLVLAPIALGIGLLVMLEAFTGIRLIREIASAVFGAVGRAEYGAISVAQGAIDTRFGLTRAMGPFSHPILAGLFFASLLPLYYFSGLRGWPWMAGMTAGAFAIFSLSSSAFLAIVLFVVLATYDRLRRLISFLNWPIFIASSSITLLVLQVVSQNGLISILIRYTMNPASGYYRLLIWEYGSRSVERHPLFGIGFEAFDRLPWMLDSVDTIWLAWAIRHGLPAAILMGLATILSVVGLALSASRTRTVDGTLMMGIIIALTVFFILGFTVSFFGGLLIWFVILLGIGTTLGSIAAPKRRMVPVRRKVRQI